MKLLLADARHIPLADGSVQCVVTSPPYWGLRDYGLSDGIGLEPTLDEYIENMRAVARELWRVLRDDGTLWLNLGDCYASSWPAPNTRRNIIGNPMSDGKRGPQRQSRLTNGLKEKDLVGLPWRVAFALQADGWHLRSDIIWAKPNPMPESVRDRPTRAHEYLFLMTKSARYYYDGKAIEEPLESSSIKRLQQKSFDTQTGGPKDYGNGSNRSARRALVNLKGRVMSPQVSASPGQYAVLTGRNKRTVWNIATQPYSGVHFATFPEKLVEPCILAGTSPKACGVCGAPWERAIERKSNYEKREAAHMPGNAPSKVDSTGWRPPTITDNGWRPTCEHNDASGKCMVLDPFCGSGTVGAVAQKHGRLFVGLDMQPKYLDLARERIGKAVRMWPTMEVK